MARLPITERKALAKRRAEFRESQPDEPPVMERSERVALEAAKAKAAREAAQNVEAKAAAGPPENKALDTDDLENKSKAELYDLATERDIEGRSSMSKAELIEVLGG